MHGIDKLEAIKMFGMKCPSCHVGTCMVTNLSKKYEPMLKEIQAELLLPATELGILQTLHSEEKPQRPSDIAAELDCSYQLVGRRSVRLEERGLVKRLKDENNNRIIEITDIAEASYFAGNESKSLDIGNEDNI